MSKPQYLPEYRIYKAYNKPKDGKYLGAASAFQAKIATQDNKRRVLLFWTMANQTGYDAEKDVATFDWKENHIVVKLDDPDVGEILCVLNGVKTSAGQSGGKYEGMFHQNDKGNSSIVFKKVEGKGYQVRLSAKKGEKVSAISHTISFSEAEILRILLTKYIERKYQW